MLEKKVCFGSNRFYILNSRTGMVPVYRSEGSSIMSGSMGDGQATGLTIKMTNYSASKLDGCGLDIVLLCEMLAPWDVDFTVFLVRDYNVLIMHIQM